MAGTWASDLAASERIVVAGGAYGIEGAVHRAALASGGDTITVLANGVDRAYPAGHSELLDRVANVWSTSERSGTWHDANPSMLASMTSANTKLWLVLFYIALDPGIYPEADLG